MICGNDFLFLAGDGARLASIKIRCIQIAERIGAPYLLNVKNINDIPDGFKFYVCVKPDFGPSRAEELGRKKRIIWDILDDTPPKENIYAYVASTKSCANLFQALGNIEVIPHHHCNFERSIITGD